MRQTHLQEILKNSTNRIQPIPPDNDFEISDVFPILCDLCIRHSANVHGRDPSKAETSEHRSFQFYLCFFLLPGKRNYLSSGTDTSRQTRTCSVLSHYADKCWWFWASLPCDCRQSATPMGDGMMRDLLQMFPLPPFPTVSHSTEMRLKFLSRLLLLYRWSATVMGTGGGCVWRDVIHSLSYYWSYSWTVQELVTFCMRWS